MRVRTAVLFDLWGTLVPSSSARREACFAAMAAELGVDAECFSAAFRASHGERFTGATGSLTATVALMAARCGGSAGDDAVARAVHLRLDLTRAMLVPDRATLAVLGELRARKVPLALVSDSSIETPSLWAETPLSKAIHVTAFSCLLGVRKPDPRIYLHAVEQLGVTPAQCLYVGDGGGGELTGAAALGMRVVRLRVPGDDASDRYDDDQEFTGPEISELSQLLDVPELR